MLFKDRCGYKRTRELKRRWRRWESARAFLFYFNSSNCSVCVCLFTALCSCK